MRFPSNWCRIEILIVLVCAAVAASATGTTPTQNNQAMDEVSFKLLPQRPSALQRQLQLATAGDINVTNDLAAALPDLIFWDAFELCGNGAIDGGEACDRDNLNGQTCSTAGYTAGTLTCTRQCQLDTSQCTGKVCVVGSCNSDADCGAAQCGPCFLNVCIGFQAN